MNLALISPDIESTLELLPCHELRDQSEAPPETCKYVLGAPKATGRHGSIIVGPSCEMQEHPLSNPRFPPERMVPITRTC